MLDPGLSGASAAGVRARRRLDFRRQVRRQRPARLRRAPRVAARFGRLSPGYQVDAGGCAADVASAVSWMLEHGAQYGGDPKRLYLMGHSAGAQIVALVGVDPQYLGAHEHAPPDLAGVIPVDGAGYDASAQLDEERDHPLLRDVDVRAFGAKAAALSPTRLVRTGAADPPFLICCSAREAARSVPRNWRAGSRPRAGGPRSISPRTRPTCRSTTTSASRATRWGNGSPDSSQPARSD